MDQNRAKNKTKKYTNFSESYTKMLIWFILTCSLVFVESANILSVLPSTSKSHFIYPNALLLELAASGHQVSALENERKIIATQSNALVFR